MKHCTGLRLSELRNVCVNFYLPTRIDDTSMTQYVCWTERPGRHTRREPMQALNSKSKIRSMYVHLPDVRSLDYIDYSHTGLHVN